ncbi:MAG: hypothetical protein GTN69_07035, partial [Armatimonadetes bacterium]|nr:hypothetical protein [Armatimonadota bacterium]
MTRTLNELTAIAQQLPPVSHVLLAYLYAWERKLYCELGALQDGVQALYDAGL